MTDKLEAAGDPDLRRALVLARSQAEPLSADDAAAQLGVHRNVARARLDRLVAAGFLRVFFARRGDRRGPGAGRPSKLYEVAPDSELLEFPDRQLSDLGKLLADELDAPALERAGFGYGRLLADRIALRPLADRKKGLERLCRRLGESGFQVAVVESSETEATLSCPTCPLRPIVQLSDKVAALDRAMWSALAESALSGVDASEITCSTEGCSDGHSTCRIVLRLTQFDGDNHPVSG